MPALTLVAPIFEAAAKKQSGGSPVLLIFVAIAAAFYFLIYRPQQRKAKAAREQTNAFDVGDEVLTAGGIVGYVIEIDGDRVTLETSVGASFVVMRQYVLRRIEPVVDADDDEDEYDEDDEHEGASDEDVDHAGGDAGHEAEEEEHHEPTDKPAAKGKGDKSQGDKADDRGDSSNPDGPPII